MDTKPVIRYVAAAVSAAVAVVYTLIAFGAITVTSTAPQVGDWVIPLAAGGAFGFLALLLVATQNRTITAVGAAMSALTIIGYFIVAPYRTPSIEIWGIAIKVAQAVLVVTLGYLAMARSEPATGQQQLT